MKGPARVLWALLVSLHLHEARRLVPSARDELSSLNTSVNDPLELEELEEEERLLGLDQARRRLKTSDDHLVVKLPGLSGYDTKQWAGHIKVDSKKAGYLFYWLFAPVDSNVEADAPLVVWMNGGPGCSSMDGLFLENGPFKVREDSSTLEVNPYAWNQQAYVLYLDQPVGTGLSYTTSKNYPKNDGDVNRHLLGFFDGLFSLHPHLESRQLFLTGESHAGHYIPSFAQAALSRNDKGGVPKFRLSGMAIGNGWFDPRTQYDVSAFAHGSGLISAAQVSTLGFFFSSSSAASSSSSCLPCVTPRY